VIIAAINLVGAEYKEFTNLTTVQVTLLTATGVTTTLSWIFCFRAMKDGLVSYLAAIDKAINSTSFHSSSMLFSGANPDSRKF
jgi:bacterial/archaeal transporter family protein